MNWLRRWKTRILIFAAVVGPGFITANVDNDAGGISTYSQAGAQFGYLLLWTMIPITIALIVVQEMASRMGAVTGKGLSDLIREEFGFRITFLMMVGLVITNFGNVLAEFAGIARSLELFGIPQIHQRAGLRGDRVAHGRQGQLQERGEDLPGGVVHLRRLHRRRAACAPRLESGLVATVKPPRCGVFATPAYLYMVIGVVGTTIAPWMQFYLQSSVVEKGITARQYGASRLDVIIGCIFTDMVAWFIIVACAATLYATAVRTSATAPTPPRRCGRWRAITPTSCLPSGSSMRRSSRPPSCRISTAYTVCEGLGFESGVDKKFREAPFFYWLYTVLIVAGAGVILIPEPAPDQDHRAVAGGERHRAAVRAGLHAAAHQ